MPARRLAASGNLAFRVQWSRPVRARHGACPRGAAVRAPGLFRRNRRNPEGRVLKPTQPQRTMGSTHNHDRHLSLAARDVDRYLAAVTPQQDIGNTMPRLQAAQVQVVEKIRQHRPLEPDLITDLIEAQTEAR